MLPGPRFAVIFGRGVPVVDRPAAVLRVFSFLFSFSFSAISSVLAKPADARRRFDLYASMALTILRSS